MAHFRRPDGLCSDVADTQSHCQHRCVGVLMWKGTPKLMALPQKTDARPPAKNCEVWLVRVHLCIALFSDNPFAFCKGND